MTDYTAAPATKILATHCACCRRPLLDAKSVECGVGPICRKKYLDLDGLDEDTRKRANVLVYECAATDDPEVLMGNIAELSLLGCDTIATKLADRCGAVSVTQAADDALVVRSGYSADFVNATRGLPGRRWIKEEKTTCFHSAAWGKLSAALADCYSGLLRFEGADGIATFHRLADLSAVPVKVAEAPAAAPSGKVEHKGSKVEDLVEAFPFEPDSKTSRAHAAATLRAQLTKAGFEKVTDSRLLPSRCREEVWERAVVTREDKPEVGHFVRVFTTIEGDEVRSAAKDSIKVVGGRRYSSKRSGAWKLAFYKLSNEKRVHRTGTVEGIANRTISRCRDAFVVCRDDHRAFETKKAA